MLIDARTLPSGTLIDAEICVVGAGAAGITIAREFAAADFQVVVLESGGLEFELDTQQLYEAQIVAKHFPDAATTRLRLFGGTTNHWGGYCLPFDEIDFERREDFPNHGWPFAKAHLDPWYARAQQVCQLGPYDYQPARWDRPGIGVPEPFRGPVFQRKILQENPLRFGSVYLGELRAASRLTIYLHANAFHFDAGDSDAEVRGLSVKTFSGGEFTVRARFYVLASGGMENARLLLASGRVDGPGLGNANDVVGRYFMTHLVYDAGAIVPADSHMNVDFEVNDPWTPGKYRIDRCIGISSAAMRDLHLPNIRMDTFFKFSEVADALGALKRLLHGEGPGGSALEDLSTLLNNFEGVSEFAIRKALFTQGVPIKEIQLGCSSEQQPHPQSRVKLGSVRDRLGMSELVVDWQVLEADRLNAARTIRLLGTEVGRTGFGRLRSTFGENDEWPENFYGDGHHMGTTRMHEDPMLGVVDVNCRVHGMSNLYVAGSSVFPTGSANNPTLTIVALALRLADHLKGQLK